MAVSVKVWAGAATAVALAGGGWLGAGVYAGIEAEKALNAAQTPKPHQSWRLAKVQHQRGLLSSSGGLDLTWQPGCGAEEGADEPVTLHVTYSLSHLPLPSGLLRAQWKAVPAGDGVAAFEELFGKGAALQGEGVAGLGGKWRSDMQLPAVALRRAGEAVEVAPSKGFLQVDGKALGFGWTLERAVLRGSGEAVELRNLALDLDLANRHLGTGSMALKVGTLSAGFGTIDDLALRSQATEQGDRLDMSVTPSARQVTAGGRTLRDLSMEIGIKGVDTKSVETLSTTFEASCGFKSLTADEAARTQKALLTLLTKGFSMGIPKLAGKSDDGGIEGQFTIELTPAGGPEPALVKQLKSSGQLTLTGKLVGEEQKQFAINTGLALAEGTGLKASFSYADGLLKVNGRTSDASDVQQKLAYADARLHEALQISPRSIAKAEQPEPVLPLPAAEPEAQAASEPVAVAEAAPLVPAPVAALPAPGAACASMGDCYAVSLQAARAEDVDALRRVATQIDALPKPDLGNRAVARKLNDSALAALKQGNAAEAVAALRQALKENPRDVEVAGNLGYALVKADQAVEAASVLGAALVLDPRRSSTWTPLAEALALSGRAADAQAALWAAFQWSGNRDKSVAYYQDRAANETRAPLQALYARMAQQVTR